MNVWDSLLNDKDTVTGDIEEDVKKTCLWLNEAGFPQYVQMFNDGQFPLSLKLVEEDHKDFDGGMLMALFRRIEILNKSTEVKTLECSCVDRHHLLTIKRPGLDIIKEETSNEDKENVQVQTTLSTSWAFEPITRRWAHIKDIIKTDKSAFDNPMHNLRNLTTVYNNLEEASLPSSHTVTSDTKNNLPSSVTDIRVNHYQDKSHLVARSKTLEHPKKQHDENNVYRDHSIFNTNLYREQFENLGITEYQKILSTRRNDTINQMTDKLLQLGRPDLSTKPGTEQKDKERGDILNKISELDQIIDLLVFDVNNLDQMRSKIRSNSSSNIHDRSRTLDYINNRYSLPIEMGTDPPYLFTHDQTRSTSTRLAHTPPYNNHEHAMKTYDLCDFNVSQVNILQKLSVLGCTSVLEKYSPPEKNALIWRMPKPTSQKPRFTADRFANVFRLSFSTLQIRYGQPYPPAILNIFQFLRQHGPVTLGIFRKSGLKSRTNLLRNAIEENPDFNRFDGCCPLDVADILKGFYRDLPDRLLTAKLSNTLVALYTYVPKQHQFEALQLALLSLPDENRTALAILIEFLSYIAEYSEVTMMDITNLSLIFAPNLFNFPIERNSDCSLSQLVMKKCHSSNLDQLSKQHAAQLCIMDMITYAHSVFQVTESTIKKNHSNLNHSEYACNNSLMLTAYYQEWLLDRFKQIKSVKFNHKPCWTNIRKDCIRKFHRNKALVEQLSYSKIGYCQNNEDGIALRTWKVVIDIENSPESVYINIKDRRYLWDPSIAVMQILDQISEAVDVVQLTSYNAYGSNTPRCFNLLRGYQMEISSGAYLIASESINIKHCPNSSDTNTSVSDPPMVTGHVFCDHFMIEPLSTSRCRVTWISRVDLFGYHSDWYNHHWGHDLVRRIIKLKKFSEFSVDYRNVLSNHAVSSRPNLQITEQIFDESRETFI